MSQPKVLRKELNPWGLMTIDGVVGVLGLWPVAFYLLYICSPKY